MKSTRIIVFSVLALLLVSAYGFCEDAKQKMPDRKKMEAEAKKALESEKAALAFMKKRNVLSGKMMVGFAGENTDIKPPAGITVNNLNTSNSSEEFFISMDRTGSHSDRINMLESLLPKKKSK